MARRFIITVASVTIIAILLIIKFSTHLFDTPKTENEIKDIALNYANSHSNHLYSIRGVSKDKDLWVVYMIPAKHLFREFFQVTIDPYGKIIKVIDQGA